MNPWTFSGAQSYDRRGVPTGGRARETHTYSVYMGTDDVDALQVRPTPDTLARMVARHLQVSAPEIDGAVKLAYGFGEWGVEPSVEVRTTNNLPECHMRGIVAVLLAEFGCTLAYVEIDGERAEEWNVNGERSPIEGFRGGEGE